jgi:hypothetical protein
MWSPIERNLVLRHELHYSSAGAVTFLLLSAPYTRFKKEESKNGKKEERKKLGAIGKGN